MLFKNPTTCTFFFLWFAVHLDPCHLSTRYPNSQCHNGIVQVLYHDHVSTASSQRDCESQSTLNPRLHDNLVNRCGCRSSSHSSPLSETRHVSGNSLLKNISYSFMSDITCRFMCVFFLYRVSNSGRKTTARLFTQTGHECR